jgi:transposase-like protein
MGLSRRVFTKEFKESAVGRLELAASVAEVVRACEVNPNVLNRWRRELRKYAARAYSGEGCAVGRRVLISGVQSSRAANLDKKDDCLTIKIRLTS